MARSVEIKNSLQNVTDNYKLNSKDFVFIKLLVLPIALLLLPALSPSKAKNVECVNAIDERHTFLHNFIMHSFEFCEIKPSVGESKPSGGGGGGTIASTSVGETSIAAPVGESGWKSVMPCCAHG